MVCEEEGEVKQRTIWGPFNNFLETHEISSQSGKFFKREKRGGEV